MDKVLDYLEGKKTYIAGAINFVAWGLWGAKIIDDRVRDMLVGIAGTLALYGVYGMVKRNLKNK